MIKFCQHELVRIRNSAEIAALYEGQHYIATPLYTKKFADQMFYHILHVVSTPSVP